MGSNSRIDKLKQEQEKTDKHYMKLMDRLSKKEHILQKKIDELGRQYDKLNFDRSEKYYAYEKKIQKICKHDKYPVCKSANLRDDASFNYWLYCSNCDADLGHE